MAVANIDCEYEKLGFSLHPSFISVEEQSEIAQYLKLSLSGSADESNLSIAERNRARKAGSVVAVSEHKYGREFYIQTESFQIAADESDGCYSRTPADRAKHSIPKEAPKLEDERNRVIRKLAERIGSHPDIIGEKLYLIQCIEYNGKYERGKHIDNKVNGGNIIVGCTIMPHDRYIELSGK